MIAFRRIFSDSTPQVRHKVTGMYIFLLSINIVLWAVTVYYAMQFPFLLPIAFAAYGFGLKHAVDADHIAAIDNVTRKLMQEKKQPVTVGLFFSLGHSTVVVIMSVLVAAGVGFIRKGLVNGSSSLLTTFGLIGTSISAIFLIVIGVINLVILFQALGAFKYAAAGNPIGDNIDEYLNKRGFFARIFRGLFKSIDTSWKMYPVGFLFGLGFDTASEIAILTVSGSLATQNIPFYVLLLFPLLFTAGMSLIDTTDGILMLGAYGWAFMKPIRKLYYNVSITTISVFVAFVIGGIETISVISGLLNLHGGVWDVVNGVSFGKVGISIVIILLLSWAISSIIYRIKKYDDIEISATQTGAQE